MIPLVRYGQLKKLDAQKPWTKVLIVLQQRLHDSDWDVRQTAFNSLRQLFGRKADTGVSVAVVGGTGTVLATFH